MFKDTDAVEKWNVAFDALTRASRTPQKRIVNSRAWNLARDHYTICFRLSGNGLIGELIQRRRAGASLRKALADVARDLRVKRRSL